MPSYALTAQTSAEDGADRFGQPGAESLSVVEVGYGPDSGTCDLFLFCGRLLGVHPLETAG
jgi:hypothetical protein